MSTAGSGLKLNSPGSGSVLLTRLSLMMFLQYFVQGAYLPIASVYVEKALGFSSYQVGLFSAALAVGPIVAPFIFGELADRWYASERVMAVCHLLGGILMIWLWKEQRTTPVIILGTLYSILYVPTILLTNSLAFRHLRNSDMEFPWIRLFGTIGYIVPAFLIEVWWLRDLRGAELESARSIAFAISGFAGIAMGLYCLTLPSTPPAREKHDYAPAAVMSLLRQRGFLVLVIVSFLIAMVHIIILTWYSPFLKYILATENLGAWEQRISSVGQMCEIGVFVILGLIIKSFGLKRTMLLGLTSYMVRALLLCVVFMFDMPFAARITLATASQALHGFCFVCFMAVAYMYVDKVAPRDARGSMQTLYGVFTLSLGFFVGGLLAGDLAAYFSTGESGSEVRDWPSIWLCCAALSGLCVVLFAVFFPKLQTDGSAETRQT